MLVGSVLSIFKPTSHRQGWVSWARICAQWCSKTVKIENQFFGFLNAMNSQSSISSPPDVEFMAFMACLGRHAGRYLDRYLGRSLGRYLGRFSFVSQCAGRLSSP